MTTVAAVNETFTIKERSWVRALLRRRSRLKLKEMGPLESC